MERVCCVIHLLSPGLHYFLFRQKVRAKFSPIRQKCLLANRQIIRILSSPKIIRYFLNYTLEKLRIDSSHLSDIL